MLGRWFQDADLEVEASEYSGGRGWVCVVGFMCTGFFGHHVRDVC